MHKKLEAVAVGMVAAPLLASCATTPAERPVSVTGSITLGVLETLSHMLIDDFKCANRISYDLDQALHVGCKVVWLALLYFSS